MISASTLAMRLIGAPIGAGAVAVAFILAIATLILALGIALAIMSAAKQGCIDVKINVNLGGTRRRPP